jgi:uncharacterized membrane-anchored protein
MIWRLVLAAGQIAVIAGLAAQAEWTLQTGTRVRLDTEPVDPRSLFQGDYVRLGYPAARSPVPFKREPGETLWLTLVAQGEVRTVAAVTRDRPPAPAVALRATAPASPIGPLALGLETIFVPEGEGRALEARVPGRKLVVEAVIAPDGTARPAALLVDGRVAYRSGLF